MIQSSYLSQISQVIFVEKKLSCGEILRNFGKFWEILGDFATIYALSCGEKLSPKSKIVEKKWQIWCLGGWRGGAMISPPTHCPRPFHLRPRPQLDFFRITRIRKSCGMIFLVWTQLHTWWTFENSSSLNTEAFLKRFICVSVSSRATFCQSLEQWIIKEGTI